MPNQTERIRKQSNLGTMHEPLIDEDGHVLSGAACKVAGDVELVIGEDEADVVPEDEFAESAIRSTVNRAISSLWFQLGMLVVVFVDIGILVLIIIQHASKSRDDNTAIDHWLLWVAMSLMIFFIVEIGVRMWLTGIVKFFIGDGSDGKKAIYNTVEFCVLFISFGLELLDLIESYQKHFPQWVEDLILEISVIPIIILRIIKLAIMLKTRSELSRKYVRQFVSADRRRFKQDGFDLDLTYIVDNKVIAMSWPSSSLEAFYRNNIRDVARFLDDKHADRYRVYPLCSERKYDETHFHYQVRRFKLDDHNPCDLGMMVDFIVDVRNWLIADEENIIVVHCKGGKGRTGTMICAWLLYSGVCRDASDALKYFGTLRSSDNASKVQGVESPSQDRFVRHFARMVKMNSDKPLEQWAPSILTGPELTLKGITVHKVPLTLPDPRKLWFVILQGSTNQLLYCSDCTQDYQVKASNRYVPAGTRHPAKTGRAGMGAPSDTNVIPGENGAEASIEYSTNRCKGMKGDLHIQFIYPKEQGRVRKKIKNTVVFEMWLNTFFIEEPVTRLAQMDIDGPHKDKKGRIFNEHFGIDLHWDPASLASGRTTANADRMSITTRSSTEGPVTDDHQDV